jgi:hypothetical protein
MAASRPSVLIASSGGYLKDGEHARLAAEDTGASLGGAILEVLRDGELRERIAAGGHAFVRARHDRRVVARQVCDAYIRTLADAGREGTLAHRPRVSPKLGSMTPSYSGAI